MILLECFLVRLMIGITKNPSRIIIHVILMTKKTRFNRGLKSIYINVEAGINVEGGKYL